ncbi:MAG: 3-deoxy-D-manno-octulosonic acid transferase [Bacteroidales bacterium]|nr:3-deoxy-D-manno-octulosonic acid transferase [Bacteroidales bacterium]
MRLFYTIGIHLYKLLIRVAALFNQKASLWLKGRKDLLKKLEVDLAQYSGKTIWIHSASLGEFEQGRPLIENLKQQHPELKILVTFFSPSGYEVRKDYPLADFIYYLPIDTVSNARQLISLIKPELVIFIKYEFWFNYLNELHKKQIPVVFISTIFRPQQYFFKFYGSWARKHLKNVKHFFVQNEASKNLLKGVGIDQVSISGDTRFDRVASIAQQVKPNNLVEVFKGTQPLFLAGSSWPEDEKSLLPLLAEYPDMKFIIAPHLIDAAHIFQIMQLFPNSISYSKATTSNVSSYQVLVIDNIGMLSSLYQYANYALIGGGFGAGIHNTLEAATFGMPIFIGPNYHKFQEAKELIAEDVAFVFKDAQQLNTVFESLNNDQVKYRRVVESSQRYVQSKTGATQMILDLLEDYL